jgi:hypothetical protein
VGGKVFGGYPQWLSRADATIDEIYLWDRHMEMDQGDESSPYQHVKFDIWGKGRYHKGGSIEFTSGEIDLEKFRTRRGRELLVLGVCWNAYIGEIKDYFELGYAPVSAECNLSLLVPEGAGWTKINELPMRKSYYQWVWRELAERRIKYGVNFQISSPNGLNTILLDTPIFDDISIYYSGGAKFLSWILV